MMGIKRTIFLLVPAVFVLFAALVPCSFPADGPAPDPSLSSCGPDVPRGVKYKRASQELNDRVLTQLEEMLKNPDMAPDWFVGNTVVVGPMLWRKIDPSKDPRFGDTGRFMIMILGPNPAIVPGGVMRTDEARKACWDVLWKMHPDLANASVRKANSGERSFLSVMAPYDPEDPLFTLDTGDKQFIINVMYDKNAVSMIWIDVVGDLNELSK